MEKKISTSFHTYLSLITINGRAHNVTLNNNIKRRNNDQQIMKINNFYMIKLHKMDTTILLYSKGGFKITIGCNKTVIKNLHLHLKRVLDLLALFFKEKLKKVTMKITQISILIRPIRIIDNILNYKNMQAKMLLRDNLIIYNKMDYTFSHEINFVAHECGQSSYYFTITIKNTREAGIKIYNNFRAVLMCFDKDKVAYIVDICKDFLNYLMNISLQ